MFAVCAGRAFLALVTLTDCLFDVEGSELKVVGKVNLRELVVFRRDGNWYCRRVMRDVKARAGNDTQ